MDGWAGSGTGLELEWAGSVDGAGWGKNGSVRENSAVRDGRGMGWLWKDGEEMANGPGLLPFWDGEEWLEEGMGCGGCLLVE